MNALRITRWILARRAGVSVDPFPKQDQIQPDFGTDPDKRQGSQTPAPKDQIVANPETPRRDQLQAGTEGAGGGSVGQPGRGPTGSDGLIGSPAGSDQLVIRPATAEAHRDTKLGSLEVNGGGSSGDSYPALDLPGIAQQRLLAQAQQIRAPAADADAGARGEVAQKFGPSIFRINSFVHRKFQRRHNL